MTKAVVTEDDVHAFLNICGDMRAAYMHYRELFEPGDPQHSIFSEISPIFFYDINRILLRYLIVEVCKLADPARDFRRNENLSGEFFLNRADFSTDQAAFDKLKYRGTAIREFGKKLKPARDKLISHSDRTTILRGIKGLGGADTDEWTKFWLNVQDFVKLLCERYLGQTIYINGGANSDAGQLVETLRRVAHLR
jgi:AbiU2